MTPTRTDSVDSISSTTSNSSPISSSESYVSTECDTKSGSDSSTSTVPGPGAFTGKVVKALGEATLRGFGRLVMARHLAVVTHTFPHTDEHALKIKNIDSIYNDLLEFSRPGMYSEEVNGKTLALILEQVGTGQTRHLVKAVAGWHPTEMHILLLNILTQSAHLWNPSLRGVFSSPTSALSRSNAGAGDNEPSVLRLIFFFSKMIRSSSSACRIVLGVGFLDVLLSLNHSYRFGVVKWHSVAKETYNLYIACNAALYDILGYPEHRDFVKKHPICALWPVSASRPNAIIPFQNRQRALFLSPETDVILDDPSPFAYLSIPAVCALPCLSTVPMDELVKSLTFEVTYDQAVRILLARTPYKGTVKLLRKIFLHLSELAESRSRPNKISWRYQIMFSLHFIKQLSNIGPERQALLDAGAIEYLAVCVRELAADATDAEVSPITTPREGASDEYELWLTTQFVHQTINALKFGGEVHFVRPRARTR